MCVTQIAKDPTGWPYMLTQCILSNEVIVGRPKAAVCRWQSVTHICLFGAPNKACICWCIAPNKRMCATHCHLHTDTHRHTHTHKQALLWKGYLAILCSKVGIFALVACLPAGQVLLQGGSCLLTSRCSCLTHLHLLLQAGRCSNNNE